MGLRQWFKRTGEPGQILETVTVDFAKGGLTFEPPRWRIEPVIAWYDCWVGVFVDREKRRLYILPLPCLGVRIYWG